MSTSVWEWCQDWYGDYPAGNLIDPVGCSGPFRSFRGGGGGDVFSSGGSFPNHFWHALEAWGNNLGLRLVLTE